MTIDLQTGFYFNVRIVGKNGKSAETAFQEVSGLSCELGVEEVVCGGENRFKYRLPNVAASQNLVLKRGVSGTISPLVKWVRNTLEGGFAEAIAPKDLDVNLLDEKGNPSVTWSFNKAYPLKWITADLKSAESEILIETIEFAYQYFTVKGRG